MLSVFSRILPALDRCFGTTGVWQLPETGEQVPITGRFQIDPQEVTLPGPAPEGLNTTQTWFYVDSNHVAYPDRRPGEHDLLWLRGLWWEIVQIDADDLGELGYRLIRAGERVSPYGPVS